LAELDNPEPARRGAAAFEIARMHVDRAVDIRAAVPGLLLESRRMRD
jgi:hypothetical protein